MEPQQNDQAVETQRTPHPVNQITPVSKYLALALFILLPFVGGYVGWNFAQTRSLDNNLYAVPQMQPVVVATSTDMTEANTPPQEKISFNPEEVQHVTFNAEYTGYFIKDGKVYYSEMADYSKGEFSTKPEALLLTGADVNTFRVVMSDPIEKAMLYGADKEKTFYFEKEVPAAIGSSAEMLDHRSGYLIADGGLYSGPNLLIAGNKIDLTVYEMELWNEVPAPPGWSHVYVHNEKLNQWYALGVSFNENEAQEIEKPNEASLGPVKYQIR